MISLETVTENPCIGGRKKNLLVAFCILLMAHSCIHKMRLNSLWSFQLLALCESNYQFYFLTDRKLINNGILRL